MRYFIDSDISQGPSSLYPWFGQRRCKVQTHNVFGSRQRRQPARDHLRTRFWRKSRVLEDGLHVDDKELFGHAVSTCRVENWVCFTVSLVSR